MNRWTTSGRVLARELAIEAFSAYQAGRSALGLATPRATFVLSHMRAGTSLLSHFLNAHPRILSAGELHISYHQQRDLQRLYLKSLVAMHQLPGPECWIVDKILHNHLTPSDDFLQSGAVSRFVFLIREPEETLRSCVQRSRISGRERPKPIEEYAAYYCDRLEHLQRQGQVCAAPETSLLIEFEQLIARTAETLACVQALLGLTESFPQEYPLTRVSGQIGFGDNSESIRAGKVIPHRRREPIDIPPQVLEKCQAAYQDCRETLSARCSRAT